MSYFLKIRVYHSYPFINNLAPIEKMINEARTIQNLHNLIKNNGQDFNLTQEQIELAKKLQ